MRRKRFGAGSCSRGFEVEIFSDSRILARYGSTVPVPVPAPLAVNVTPTVFDEAPINVKSVVPTRNNRYPRSAVMFGAVTSLDRTIGASTGCQLQFGSIQICAPRCRFRISLCA